MSNTNNNPEKDSEKTPVLSELENHFDSPSELRVITPGKQIFIETINVVQFAIQYLHFHLNVGRHSGRHGRDYIETV